MNLPLNCPTHDQWREFASAALAREAHDALDGHLEACAACQETLAALDETTGPLGQVLAGLDQGPAADLLASDPGYRDAVARAKAIRRSGIECSVASSQPGGADAGCLPPDTTLGAYVLGESIGAGGMGRVYKAVHQRMQRTVAIKILSSRWLDREEARTRFRREVEAAARLSHPHVVTAFDAGEADGHHYLVMEYVSGRNLADVVRQGGPLPVPAALDYILQAAHGLEHAHEVGIVHRDIKPGNLLLDGDTVSGSVKVLDMGIARAIWADGDASQSDLTAAQTMLGTAAFMAPEQAANPRRVDGRADIYSLGCTLYYLLTGQNVYDGETTMEVVLAHREQPIPSIRQRRPDCPESVDRLFQTMVAKRPEDRPATMRAVIAELERLQADLSSSEAIPMREAASRLPSQPRRFAAQRISFRSSVTAAGIALAAVAAIGVVLASMGKLPWQQDRAGGQAIAASGSAGDDAKTIDVTPINEKTPGAGAPADAPGKEGQNPADASPQTIERFTSFLEGIDPRRQAITGQWEWDGQSLTSPATVASFADLRLPGKPPEEYMLTVAAERKSGSDALRLGLVSGDRPFVVVVDLGSNVTSLGMLDSFGPGEHATTVRNAVFRKNKLITVSCKVRTRDRRTQLDVYVEGERWVSWAGETASLSLPPDAPKDAGLFVGALKSSFRITRLELTPLIDDQPAPRWKTPPLTPKLDLVKVAPGKFWMGAADSDKEASADQKPRHEVRISRPFAIGKHEVTRDEFAEVMDLARGTGFQSVRHAGEPSTAEDNEELRLPIVGVSWFTAVEFCNQLSLRHGLKPYYALKDERVTIRGGDGFRLPTEAEWEFACRAGTETKWYFGDNARLLDEYEWTASNSRGRPRPVGKLKPNPLGLHDMLGNVPEWCWDRYDPEYYRRSEMDDPPGSSRGEQRVVRGGSASHRAAQTAAASRTSLGAAYGIVDPKDNSGKLPGAQSVAAGSRGVGLRVARSLE